ncbi:MAG: hypothetical protein ABEH78_01920 [Haloferacaceae archaeon]
MSHVISELKENWSDPEWIRGRLEHRVAGSISALRYGADGLDVPSADWDNLFVLDACRADLFESRADIDAFDSYRRVRSKGSSTEEWVQKNWVGREFRDVVYVTANPTVARYTPRTFYDRVDVFEDGFDRDAMTVYPETVAERAREAFAPDKRIVVHFMQPHAPFYPSSVDVANWDPGLGDTMDLHGPWKALRKGEVSREEVERAYAETFDAVLPVATELAGDLPGRSVITADHGNASGRLALPLPLRIYGHPTGLRYPELVEVPWAVLDGERREITEGTIDRGEVDEDVVTDRLRAFGYV